MHPKSNYCTYWSYIRPCFIHLIMVVSMHISTILIKVRKGTVCDRFKEKKMEVQIAPAQMDFRISCLWTADFCHSKFVFIIGGIPLETGFNCTNKPKDLRIIGQTLLLLGFRLSQRRNDSSHRFTAWLFELGMYTAFRSDCRKKNLRKFDNVITQILTSIRMRAFDLRTHHNYP